MCQNVVPETTEAKKRYTKRLHMDFKAQMMHCPDNGEGHWDILFQGCKGQALRRGERKP